MEKLQVYKDKFKKEITDEFKYNYRSLHTIQLLNLLKTIRLANRYNYEIDFLELEKYEDYEELQAYVNDTFSKITNALKTELSKRDHIPNKKESKILRRNKAQGKLQKIK